MPTQIRLPVFDWFRGDQAVQRFEEVGSGDVEGIERANLDVFEVHREIESGASFLKSATV